MGKVEGKSRFEAAGAERVQGSFHERRSSRVFACTDRPQC